MSISMKNVLFAVGAVVAIGVVDDGALAQTKAPRASSSVLPSGGGQALIDRSDTVILLLDRQEAPEAFAKAVIEVAGYTSS
jgi:hypothetical protein